MRRTAPEGRGPPSYFSRKTEKEILITSPQSPALSLYIRHPKIAPFSPLSEKGIPHTSKNPPACADTHIGHEEKHLKCSSSRLKCSFGLPEALYFNYLQKPKNRSSRGRSNAHSIPFAILRGGLIRVKINDVSGVSWEGHCSAARMPKRAKREIICDVSICIIRSLWPHDIQRIASRIPSRTFICGGR